MNGDISLQKRMRQYQIPKEKRRKNLISSPNPSPNQITRLSNIIINSLSSFLLSFIVEKLKSSIHLLPHFIIFFFFLSCHSQNPPFLPTSSDYSLSPNFLSLKTHQYWSEKHITKRKPHFVFRERKKKLNSIFVSLFSSWVVLLQSLLLPPRPPVPLEILSLSTLLLLLPSLLVLLRRQAELSPSRHRSFTTHR